MRTIHVDYKYSGSALQSSGLSQQKNKLDNSYSPLLALEKPPAPQFPCVGLIEPIKKPPGGVVSAYPVGGLHHCLHLYFPLILLIIAS